MIFNEQSAILALNGETDYENIMGITTKLSKTLHVT